MGAQLLRLWTMYFLDNCTIKSQHHQDALTGLLSKFQKEVAEKKRFQTLGGALGDGERLYHIMMLCLEMSGKMK